VLTSADKVLSFCGHIAVILLTICCRFATKNRGVSSNRRWRPILRASICQQTIHSCRFCFQGTSVSRKSVITKWVRLSIRRLTASECWKHRPVAVVDIADLNDAASDALVALD